MAQKLVSIITPTYNCGKFIARTIASVQAQSYENWEMIIVDDRSQDDTCQIVQGFMEKDPRIQYHLLPENSGAAVARTTAMELANGSYMAFLDSDDIWMPDKLTRQIAWMEAHDHAISCTAYAHIDEADQPLGRTIKTMEKTNYNRLLLDCPVGNSSVVYNAEKLGKFQVPNIRKRNDDALWLKMLKKEPYIWGMPEVLMQYRVRQNSISSNKLSVIKYHWILYRQVEHLSVPRSAFHIFWWCLIKVLRIK